MHPHLQVIYTHEEAREKRHELDKLVPTMVEDVTEEVHELVKLALLCISYISCGTFVPPPSPIAHHPP